MHIFGTIVSTKSDLLLDENKYADFANKVIDEAGVQNLGHIVHKFPEGGGFTVLIGLAESHVAVHTWPEFDRVTLDVYLCNFKHDNTAKCESIYKQLSEYFEPDSIKTKKEPREP